MPNSSKNTHEDKPTNVQVTLMGPIKREQLFKIQEVLRYPSQYQEKLPPNARPTTGEYAKSFNKFIPKKVEVNEVTVNEVIGFGHFMRKSDEEVTEAIDLYKALRDDTMDQRTRQMNPHNRTDYQQNMSQMPTTIQHKIRLQEKLNTLS